MAASGSRAVANTAMVDAHRECMQVPETADAAPGWDDLRLPTAHEPTGDHSGLVAARRERGGAAGSGRCHRRPGNVVSGRKPPAMLGACPRHTLKRMLKRIRCFGVVPHVRWRTASEIRCAWVRSGLERGEYIGRGIAQILPLTCFPTEQTFARLRGARPAFSDVRAQAWRVARSVEPRHADVVVDPPALVKVPLVGVPATDPDRLNVGEVLKTAG
jgi:hypothetical protein